MTPSRQAIATMSTSDVALAYHEIALCKSLHMIAHIIDNADKLMADCHRHRNRFLRPRVPVVNVNICSADRRFQHTNEHVVAPDFRNGNFLEPQARLGLGLHDGFHHLLHEGNYPQISQIHTDSAGDLKSMSISLCNLWTNLATVEMMTRKCP